MRNDSPTPAAAVLRSATAQDLPALATVQRAAWLATYGADMPPRYLAAVTDPVTITAAWTERLTRLHSATEHLLVAEMSGRVVGYADGGPCGNDEPALRSPAPAMQLRRLYVHPDHHGSGIGAALHDALLPRLAAHAATAVLWTFGHNSNARRFYHRRGWRQDGEIRTWIIEGLVLSDVRYVRPLTFQPLAV